MNWDPVPALIQSFERTKQTNLEGFLEMLEVKRNSSNNTVYADANGSVAYFHGNFVPRRNPSFDYDLPVPGWNPRSTGKGFYDILELVRVIDPPNGWVQNCNSTPFTSAGSFSPERKNYPTLHGARSENSRGVHAVRLEAGATGLIRCWILAWRFQQGFPHLKCCSRHWLTRLVIEH